MATVQSTVVTLDLELGGNREPGFVEFQWKEFIKLHWGADAITATGDGVGNFSTTEDIITHAGSGPFGMDNDNAWWACSLPDFILHFVRQLFDVVGSSPKTRLKLSKGAGNAFASGGAPSATQVPSATGEETHHGGGTDAAPTGITTHLNSSGADDRRLMCSLTTGGDYGFYFVVHNALAVYRGPVTFAVDHVRIGVDHDNVPIADTFPKVIYVQTSIGATLNRSDMQQSTVDSSITITRTWIDDGGGGEKFSQISLGNDGNAGFYTTDVNGAPPLLPCIWYLRNIFQPKPAPAGVKGFSTFFYLHARAGDDFREAYNIRGIPNAALRFNDYAVLWDGTLPPDDVALQSWTSVDANFHTNPDTVFVDPTGAPTLHSKIQSFDLEVTGIDTTSGRVEYELKEFLKLHWGDDIITASGDGLGLFSMTGDIITHSASGAGGMNNFRAYWACSLPDDSLHSVRQFDPTDLRKMRIKISFDSGGVFNSGGAPSPVQVPSGAGESVFKGTGTDAAPLGANGRIHQTASGDRRIMGSCTNAAPWLFWWVAIDNFTGNTPFFSNMIDEAAPSLDANGNPIADANRKVYFQASSQDGFDQDLMAANMNTSGGQSEALLDAGGAGEAIVPISYTQHSFNGGQAAAGLLVHAINGNAGLERGMWRSQVATPNPDGVKGLSSMALTHMTFAESGGSHEVYNIKGIPNAAIQMKEFALLWSGGVPPDDGDGNSWSSVDANLHTFPQGVFIEAPVAPPPAPTKSAQPVRGGKLLTLRSARARPRGPIFP